jgi:hypothetical protein
MPRFAVIGLCLLWPTAVCAGQASAQFHVGIIITGKRASSTPSLGGIPAAAGAPARSSSRAADPTRAKQCAGKYRPHGAVVLTYGRDGGIRRCQ